MALPDIILELISRELLCRPQIDPDLPKKSYHGYLLPSTKSSLIVPVRKAFAVGWEQQNKKSEVKFLYERADTGYESPAADLAKSLTVQNDCTWSSSHIHRVDTRIQWRYSYLTSVWLRVQAQLPQSGIFYPNTSETNTASDLGIRREHTTNISFFLTWHTQTLTQGKNINDHLSAPDSTRCL